MLGALEKVAARRAALAAPTTRILQGAEQILSAADRDRRPARARSPARRRRRAAAARQASTASTEQASGAEDLAAAIEEIASLADTLKQQNG